MGTQLASTELSAKQAATASPKVAIIGGGCAGLAAAVRLSATGVAVTLFDSSHQLGGRARSIEWRDQTLDNGQHILLGAYARTLDFLQTCGLDPSKALLRLPLKLEMAGEFSLRSQSALPAPLHILVGLLQAQGLSWQERLAAVRIMASFRLKQFRLPQDIPLQQLLQDQPPRLIQMLWEPLCLAALNTPLSTASAQVFLNVLRDSFARSKTDSDLLLPRQDLSALLVNPAVSFIEQHGGTVRLNSAIASLHQDGASWVLEQASAQASEPTTKLSNDHKNFSHIIIATPPFRVAPLLSKLPALAASAAQCAALEYQPIYTVYLQYDPSTQLPDAMCGLANSLGQWVFDRGQLYGQAGLLAVVISAAGKHQALTQAALAAAVDAELRLRFASLGDLLWHKVVAEKRATFACHAGLQRPQRQLAHNAWLAGDYVASPDRWQDYPATIEGAIRSGELAASKLINSL